MTISTSNNPRAVVSTLPYRDTIAMVDWLCDAFGFQKRLVVRGKNGDVRHAELTFGESMIMVVPAEDPLFQKLMAHPDQLGGIETQTCYLIVADLEGHCARAKAKGAEIVFDVRVENNGERGYACRDPEGHVWMFGTYDPRQTVHQRSQASTVQRQPSTRVSVLPLVLSILTLTATAVAIWSYSEMRHATVMLDSAALSAARAAGAEFSRGRERQPAEADAVGLAAKLFEVQTAKARAEQNAAELASRLAREQAAVEKAVKNEKETQELLTQESKAREVLSQAVQQVKDQLGQEHIAREAAERIARAAAAQLEDLRFAKAYADRAAKEATDRCEQDRASRTLAERYAQDAVGSLASERNARAVAELTANELRNQLVSYGPEPQERISELRNRVEAERRASGIVERAAKDAQQQLAQEKYSRDAAERALRQAQQKLAALPSCWSCPSAAPCERP